ncbi:MAG: hypothetical protein R3284_08940 [Rubricoccaceae bacterium]|nr:hypothetical protein [Rubricoccaceae bacterium]
MSIQRADSESGVLLNRQLNPIPWRGMELGSYMSTYHIPALNGQVPLLSQLIVFK